MPRAKWVYFILILLVILFWHPVISNNGFFYDDWDFISTFSQNHATLRYFLAPHNEHFMPIFKLIFFLMHKIFGLNIIPYISLLILAHGVNICLFYYLCRLIFPRANWLPFILAVLFLSNSAYFEVLHWFTLLSAALPLMFLQVSLIFLHLYHLYNKKKYFWVSALSSFFIPFNFSLGMAGLVFIILYYFTIIKKFKLKEIKDYFKLFWPYLAAWCAYLVLYLIFVFPDAFAGKVGAADYSNVLSHIQAGALGFLLKSMGVSILMQPINIWAAGFLLINLLALFLFVPLYFILNPKDERKRILHDRGVAWFAFLGALLSYGIIALARTDLGSDAFLNWGRYHYFPAFFLTIFIGNLLPALVDVFSAVFNQQRFKLYLLFLFILYLAGQFVIIRAKAESPVRMEGLKINQDNNICIVTSVINIV